jgi:glycosyltransferase involved in cell wall biosynthesis
MMPLVSVMMPAYNAAKYIGDAIASMQEQTYLDWELIIVDDGSSDNTYEIALEASLKDDRIRVIGIDHAGCPTARNAAINACNGDMIARLDADDMQTADRLERQVNRLLSEDNLDLVTCGYAWLKGAKIIPRPSRGMVADDYFAGKGGPPCATILAWCYVYEAVGPFETEQLAGSDGDWNFRALVAGFEWGHITNPMYYQRRHPDQLSQSMRRMQRAVHEAAREKYEKLRDRSGEA